MDVGEAGGERGAAAILGGGDAAGGMQRVGRVGEPVGIGAEQAVEGGVVGRLQDAELGLRGEAAGDGAAERRLAAEERAEGQRQRQVAGRLAERQGAGFGGEVGDAGRFALAGGGDGEAAGIDADDGDGEPAGGGERGERAQDGRTGRLGHQHAQGFGGYAGGQRGAEGDGGFEQGGEQEAGGFELFQRGRAQRQGRDGAQRVAEAVERLGGEHDFRRGGGVFGGEGGEDGGGFRQAGLGSERPAGRGVRGQAGALQVAQQGRRQRAGGLRQAGGQQGVAAGQILQAAEGQRAGEGAEVEPGFGGLGRARRAEGGQGGGAGAGACVLPGQAQGVLGVEQGFGLVAFQHHGGEQAAIEAGDEGAGGIVEGEVDGERAGGLAGDGEVGAGGDGAVALDAERGEADRQVGVALAGAGLEIVEHRVEGGVERHRVHDVGQDGGAGRGGVGRGQGHVDDRGAAAAAQHAAEGRAVGDAGGFGLGVDGRGHDRVGLGRGGDGGGWRGGHGYDAAARVQHPVAAGQAGAAADFDGGGIVQQDGDFAHLAGRQRQPGEQVEILQPDRAGGQRGAGSGERHLGQGGGGEHRLAVDAVVGEVGQQRGVDQGAPFRAAGAQPGADQRMARLFAQQVHRFGRAGLAVGLALPGDGRQGQAGLRGGGRARCNGGAEDGGAGQHGEQRVAGGGFFDQAGDGGAVQPGFAQRVGDAAGEDRAGADFEEDGGAGAGGGFDGGAEQHRLAHVAPPVAGIERLAGQRRAGDGGDERRVAGLGVDMAEGGQHGVA